MNLILLLLVSWAFAFRVPSGGVKPKTAARLQAVPNREPCRAALELLDDAIEQIPYEFLNGVLIANGVLATLNLAGFDFPGVPPNLVDWAIVIAAFGNVVALALRERKWYLQRPESRVRERLEKRYDPPPSKAWTGAADWEAKINAFVEKNPVRKTLVLVDPSGTAGPNLLDDIFRGQIHVIAPALDELSLKEGLCEASNKFFGFKDRGLDDITSWIKKGIKFPFGSALLPAKIIVKIPARAADTDVLSILSDVTLLKQLAGDNVVTIVTFTNKRTSIQALPKVTQNALQVLS